MKSGKGSNNHSSNLPQRPLSHIVGEQAVLALRIAIPGECIFNETQTDYGIDCEIEIVQNGGAVTGAIIKGQVKGTASSFEVTKNGVNVATTSVRYWLELPVPVIIVRVTQNPSRVLWLEVRQYLHEKNRLDTITSTTQQTIRFNFRDAYALPDNTTELEQLAVGHQTDVNEMRAAKETEDYKPTALTQTYDPDLKAKPSLESGKEEDWVRGDPVYLLKLLETPSRESVEAMEVALSTWRFVTTSSTHRVVSSANGIIGIGQTDGVTFNLSPAPPIDNCRVECEIRIIAQGDDQSNWAGIRVRSFDFAYDFRLGYLVYLRRSGEVELYGPDGVYGGRDRIVVADASKDWTHIQVDILDSEIRVYVNGERHITHVDKTVGGKGRIFLDTFGTHAQFRNFRVYKLSRSA